MTFSKESTVSEASMHASNARVMKWFFFGFFLGIIGILIVYLRSPKVPANLLDQYTGDKRSLYQKTYSDKLKERLVEPTWIGFVTLVAVILFLYGSQVGLA
ncbi:MAG: hypothetical protein OXF06_00935 [Bacteroidetes bacterium]|nr:hypothetical protein [Bacteroidota bacterium]MCY4223376.1 hypothetical protein [Bacteroidota bacterium]